MTFVTIYTSPATFQRCFKSLRSWRPSWCDTVGKLISGCAKKMPRSAVSRRFGGDLWMETPRLRFRRSADFTSEVHVMQPFMTSPGMEEFQHGPGTPGVSSKKTTSAQRPCGGEVWESSLGPKAISQALAMQLHCSYPKSPRITKSVWFILMFPYVSQTWRNVAKAQTCLERLSIVHLASQT